MRNRRLLLVVVVAACALAVASAAGATTYYVNPSGSDANAGTSSSSAWRTVQRVNDAALTPGDSVLFQGGQTLTDATLMPAQSGAQGSPITFSSYGTGRATISNPNGAVWFSGAHDLVFDQLTLTSSGAQASVFAGSGGGGSSRITLQNSEITDTAGVGVNSPNPADTDWTIANGSISHTGDSGLIIEGSGAVITNDTISDTGWNSALGYGTHGIYAKGHDITIAGNDISYARNGQAISLRFHGARVYQNTIHDTPYAIAFFDQDPAPRPQGASTIHSNKLWNISGYGFYYDGQPDANGNPPSVAFTLASNTFSFSGGEAVNVAASGSAQVTLANNVFTGSYGSALRAAPTTVESHDDWSGAGWNIPSGRGDLSVAPDLAAPADLSPQAGSPVIDAGTTSVPDPTYTPTCDGSPLSYCGAAPDQGAVESSLVAADTTPPSQPERPHRRLGRPQQPHPLLGSLQRRHRRRLYLNGTKIATTIATSYTYGALACNNSYTLAVDAYDSAGNHSATAATAACSDGSPPLLLMPSPSDGQTVPLSLTAQVSASDPQSGIYQVTFRLDDALVCVESTRPPRPSRLPRGLRHASFWFVGGAASA